MSGPPLVTVPAPPTAVDISPQHGAQFAFRCQATSATAVASLQYRVTWKVDGVQLGSAAEVAAGSGQVSLRGVVIETSLYGKTVSRTT